MSIKGHVNRPKQLRDIDDIRIIIANNSQNEELKNILLGTLDSYELKVKGKSILLTLSSYFDCIDCGREISFIGLWLKFQDETEMSIKICDEGNVYIDESFTDLNIKDYDSDFTDWTDKLLNKIDSKYLKYTCWQDMINKNKRIIKHY